MLFELSGILVEGQLKYEPRKKLNDVMEVLRKYCSCQKNHDLVL